MKAPLLRFRRPSDIVADDLRRIVGALPICNPGHFPEPYTTDRATVRGTLDHVMRALETALQRDYMENEADAIEWRGSFDYVVVPSSIVDGAVDVKTRLYTSDVTEPRQGDIFYGRVVERIGSDDYVLWIDD